jgi:anti-sigma regulatory factor (Ser/Thr protein kinase)
MILGRFHALFPIEDASRVGEARRHAATLADECGLDEVEAGQLAIAVTELATNLVRHAKNGRMLITARPERREVEVIGIDDGPGIADVDRSMGDGYSTGGSPGTGLGALRRLTRDFDLHSQVPEGTVSVARVRGAAGQAPDDAAFSVGAISIAVRGERVCGDSWGFAMEGNRAALMVADGLGHGPDAAEASQAAIAVFAENPLGDLRQLLQETHARLRSTRGAAVMVLHADVGAGTIRSVGAGNVMGRLVSGVSDRAILCQHGTAGVTIRTPEETSTPWPPHALLVVFSDGIESRWKPEPLMPVLGRDPALAAGLLVRDHCRGRDDATVAVLRRKD